MRTAYIVKRFCSLDRLITFWLESVECSLSHEVHSLVARVCPKEYTRATRQNRVIEPWLNEWPDVKPVICNFFPDQPSISCSAVPIGFACVLPVSTFSDMQI